MKLNMRGGRENGINGTFPEVSGVDGGCSDWKTVGPLELYLHALVRPGSSVIDVKDGGGWRHQGLEYNCCKGYSDRKEAVFMVSKSMGGLCLFMASRDTHPDLP